MDKNRPRGPVSKSAWTIGALGLLLLVGAGGVWLIGLPYLTILLTLAALLYLGVFAAMVRRDRRATPAVPIRAFYHSGGLPAWVLGAITGTHGAKLLSTTSDSVAGLQQYQGGFLTVTSFGYAADGVTPFIDRNARLGGGDTHAFVYCGSHYYHLFVLTDDALVVTPPAAGTTGISVILHQCVPQTATK